MAAVLDFREFLLTFVVAVLAIAALVSMARAAHNPKDPS